MDLQTFARRFLVPSSFVSVMCLIRDGAHVSSRAEVELSASIRLARGTQIGAFCKIKAAGPLVIGENTHIGAGCFLGAGPGGLHIGDDCLIGPNCAIMTGEYRYARLGVPLRDQGTVSRGTRIGRNVLVGANSVILDGTEVGDDVIIAAGSVVSGRIPSGTIAAGNPARVVFRRR